MAFALLACVTLGRFEMTGAGEVRQWWHLTRTMLMSENGSRGIGGI
jgi:hypothetical protein